MKDEHIAVADLFRVSAIALVVFNHFVVLGSVLQPIYDGSLAIGVWAVNAFFILSGFLLGQPYLSALLERNAPPNWRLYAVRRFLRIWPAYAVVVIVSATLVIVHHGKDTSNAADIVAHLLMLHGFSTAYLFGAGNGALWTMAVDAQFYVLLPICALVLSRFTATIAASRRPAAIALAIASVIAFSLAARLAASVVPSANWNDYIFLYTVQRNALGMACAFGAGLLLALAFVHRGGVDARRWPAFLLIAFVTEAFAMDFAWLWPASNSAIRMLAYDTCGAISVSCAFIVALTLRRHSRRFARFVESRFVAGAALIAYAVYLVHYPVRDAVFSLLFERFHVPLAAPAFVMLLVAGTLPVVAIAAFALHRFVERPFLARKSRYRDAVPAIRVSN